MELVGSPPAGSPTRPGSASASRRGSSSSRGTGSEARRLAAVLGRMRRPRCRHELRTPGSCRSAAHHEHRKAGDVVHDVSPTSGGAPPDTPSATCGPTPSRVPVERSPARYTAPPGRTSDRRPRAAGDEGSPAHRCYRCRGAPDSSAPGTAVASQRWSLVHLVHPSNRHPSKPAGTGMSFILSPPGTCGPASHRHMWGSAV